MCFQFQESTVINVRAQYRTQPICDTKSKAVRIAEQQSHLPQVVLFSKCSQELSTLKSILYQTAAQKQQGTQGAKEGAWLQLRFPRLLVWSGLFQGTQKGKRAMQRSPRLSMLWHIYYLCTQKSGLESWGFIFMPPQGKIMGRGSLCGDILFPLRDQKVVVDTILKH